MPYHFSYRKKLYKIHNFQSFEYSIRQKSTSNRSFIKQTKKDNSLLDRKEFKPF